MASVGRPQACDEDVRPAHRWFDQTARLRGCAPNLRAGHASALGWRWLRTPLTDRTLRWLIELPFLRANAAHGWSYRGSNRQTALSAVRLAPFPRFGSRHGAARSLPVPAARAGETVLEDSRRRPFQ